MDDLGVIDRFLNVFNAYIDSGFGLLGGEVSFLAATLIAIDLALVGVFWALGGGSGEDVIGKLLRKTLYIGAFAFIIGNFNTLSTVVFRSFAGLGLTASGSALSEAELLRPGRLASVGVDAGRPILDQMRDYVGFPEVFLNIDSVAVLFLAWLIVIISFFILAVQLFVTLIEFKLTTLAGFVLIPFALWGKTGFLAERVLGNVVSSGIKVLVLAVIVGIGSGIFDEFTVPTAIDAPIDHALAIMLASLAMLGLGLFGPGIATGLVSGAPQLGAGAAAGTTLVGAAPVAVGAGAAAIGAGAIIGAARGSGEAPASSIGKIAAASAAAPPGQHTAAVTGANSAPSALNSKAPSWAQRLRGASLSRGVVTSAHIVRSTDHPGAGASPTLNKED